MQDNNSNKAVIENNALNEIKKTIAVVDDEPDILELVSLNLKKNGYKVRDFLDADTFYNYLKFNVPDLIVLDLMLPDADGMEICKDLRGQAKFAKIPVIILTAKGDETDKVLGLEIGADDYITKPFSPRELVARVKAVLRRDSNPKTTHISIADAIEIDLNQHETFINGNKVELTSSEFRILQLLATRKGWVYSREQILEFLGVQEKGVLGRTIDVHIKNLREKLGDYGKLIKNIRGIGYKIDEYQA